MSDKPELANSTAAPPSPEQIDALDDAVLLQRFEQGVQRLDRRVLDLPPEQLDMFFRPEAGVGRWSCRVLVGHIADAEIVQAHRIRRLAAEDHPLLANWDENAFIDAGLYSKDEGESPPAAAHVALIHTTRLWMRDWLKTLPPEAWDRQGLHSEEGPVTLRLTVAKSVWHLEHHAWFLTRKIERLTGMPENPGA